MLSKLISRPTKPSLALPDKHELIAALRAHAHGDDALSRCIVALETGVFTDPDGQTDRLGDVRLPLAQAALLAHLCEICPEGLSLEVGFGMGSSASIILGMRAAMGGSFEHPIFDPFGLGDGRGEVVEAYLQKQFGGNFNRVLQRSEIGLAQLLAERGFGSVGLAFIDGSHHFENVVTDFVLCDHLCCEGGYIVFDDACFPAIESAVNYIATNRPDYAVAHLPVPNTTVLKKIAPDGRSWDAFTPFDVPHRRDWSSSRDRKRRWRRWVRR